MNTKFAFMFFFVLLCSCHSKTESEVDLVADSTVIVLKQGSQLKVSKVYNMGVVYKNNTPYKKISIEICNNGEKPLVLAKVDVICNCMKIDFTKEPILFNQKGYINVVIDTKNQIGVFDKPIFIKSNAINNIEIVRIKGEIK